MQFKSISDLSGDIIQWLPSIPRNIDLIVGIPRSGMLPATMLALHLHAPLSSVDDYVNGRTMGAGHRLQACNGLSPHDPDVTVLVVDDSVYSGAQMIRVRQRIQEHGVQNRVLYSAPYIAPGKAEHVDLFHQVVAMPRIFEWNVMHHTILERACVDIDGVLCQSHESIESHDESSYRAQLRTLDPLFLPQKAINTLVTNRSEKYRAPTEAWLARHEIQYRHLVMMDHLATNAHSTASKYVRHKAEAYASSDTELYIGGSYQEAVEIVRLTRKPVYCIESRQMVSPEGWTKDYVKEQIRTSRSHLKRLFESVRNSLWKKR